MQEGLSISATGSSMGTVPVSDTAVWATLETRLLPLKREVETLLEELGDVV